MQMLSMSKGCVMTLTKGHISKVKVSAHISVAKTLQVFTS